MPFSLATVVASDNAEAWTYGTTRRVDGDVGDKVARRCWVTPDAREQVGRTRVLGGDDRFRAP